MKGIPESQDEENINIINRVSSLKMLPAPPSNSGLTNTNNSSSENNSLKSAINTAQINALININNNNSTQNQIPQNSIYHPGNFMNNS